ncbi:MAG: hypothetical protein DHS20C04_32240 [Hyphococcus sp.]|nr:MAG: hypothetical protein DHS20C04_32240 [Marinicaulis sp.]
MSKSRFLLSLSIAYCDIVHKTQTGANADNGAGNGGGGSQLAGVR